MEIKIKTEAKIGLIVLSTIALVIWGINFLKGRNVLKRTDVYHAVFNNVQGLEYAAPVFISGYKVGLINNLNFDQKRLDRITVSFYIEKKYRVPVGSEVMIASPDIISGKALIIKLGDSSVFHEYGDTLKSGTEDSFLDVLQSGINPVMENSRKAISQLDSLLSSMNQLFDEESVNDLKASIKNANEITGRLNDQLSPQGSMASMLSNLEIFSATLSASREKLSETIDNLSNITGTIANSELDKTIEKLSEVTGELNTLIGNVNSGKGTLGLLAGNDSLYIKLVDVSSSLDLLLQDMRERPKRYVHFSVFGKKDKK